MAAVQGVQQTGFEAWYDITHEGGTFEICLRPGGYFYCPSFQANGKWYQTGSSTLEIDWKKYGVYEFVVTDAVLRELSGSVKGAPNNWRRLAAKRPLSPAEAKLLGASGAGSVWRFEYNGGAFNVQFRGDGFNHFICPEYPAHSHWVIGGANSDELTINWGQFGTYEIRVDGVSGRGEGSAKGQPSNWRKMSWISDITPESIASEGGCGHDH
mmetsp:Transcript_24218/g.33148  ORF Transcript_24218/g.33148 Transcript_24218/m.33148 type:complete len:212 (-) Transcript_24218:338-973(-)